MNKILNPLFCEDSLIVMVFLSKHVSRYIGVAIVLATLTPFTYAASSSTNKWNGAIIYSGGYKVSSGVPVSKCHVLSNEHAVRNERRVIVSILGVRYQANVISTDKTNDLSLLKLPTCPIKHFAKISKVQPMKGDRVTSIYYETGNLLHKIRKSSGKFLGYLDVKTDENRNMFSMLIDDSNPQKGASGGGVATKHGLVSVIFGISSTRNRNLKHQTFAVDYFSFSSFLKKNHIQI